MNVTTGKTPLRLEQATLGETVSSLPAKPLDKPSIVSDEPLVVIEPTRSWVAINLRDLWAYRELLYFLTWRDVKVRYKQTALGVVWVVLQPLLSTIVFTVFLGKLARVPSDGIPYPLFVYAAMLPWTFFSSAVTNCSNSLVGNANLITKIYFPRLLMPAAPVAARMVDFGIAFIILIGLMIYYGAVITKTLLLLPLLVVLIVILALGFGIWVAGLNVKYRDVGVMLPVGLQLWMFASPVVYPSSLVPAKYKSLYNLNPLVGILDGFRSSLFGLEINWRALAISTLFIFALLVYSAYTFRRMERGFADVV
jgi:lipopolysaccharide transport system permease protein